MTRIKLGVSPTAGGGTRAATHYGRRLDESAHAGEHHNQANIHKQITTVTYDELPTFTLDHWHGRIPAGSRILGFTIKVLETVTAATATSVNFGLYEPDGTVIDADGLAAAVTIASLTAGAFIDGAGALVGDSAGLAVDGQLVVAANVDDLTAGEFTVVIEYEKPEDRRQTMNG